MNYGTVHAVLKPLPEVMLPDPRFKHMADVSGEHPRRLELSDVHKLVSTISLHEHVPEEVRVQFETARNLMLYTWFVWEFQTVAEMQTYCSLEFALRTRFPKAKRPKKRKDGSVEEVPLFLGQLLELAEREGAVIPEKLPIWPRIVERSRYEREMWGKPPGNQRSAAEWFTRVIENLPHLRNSLAHGSRKLDLFGSIFLMELCADLINALFQKGSLQPQT